MELLILSNVLCFMLGVYVGVAVLEKGIIMPLTKKGKTVKKALVKEYGKKKGESILYTMENKGTAKGLTKKKAAKKATKKTTKKK